MESARPKALARVAAGGFLAVAVTAAVVIFGFGLRERSAPPSSAACPFESPADTPVECGVLAVPADWGDSMELLKGKGGFSLFYTIVRAKARTPESDPVLVLASEPGQAGGDLLTSGWAAFDAFHRNRDVIFVDTRGTGRSRPAFTCPELDPVKARFGRLTAADAQACLGTARAGDFDPALFSTADSARDLVALRKALGPRVWNVVASGYGAALALETARLDPEGIRALILDSPGAPKASPADLDRLAAIQRVFQRLFGDCEAQPECAKAHPNLKGVFEDLTRRLAAQPPPAMFTHAANGPQGAGAPDAGDLATMLTRVVGDGAEAATMPALIQALDDLAQGRAPSGPDPVATLQAAFWRLTPPVAHGVAAVITCREVQPSVDQDGARAVPEMFRSFVTPQALALDYEAFCPVWKLPRVVENPDAAPLEPPPTLMLTGDYDTVTPGYQAAALAVSIPAAQVLRPRGLGHGLLAASGCVRDAASEFLDAPGRKLERNCSGAPPVFTTKGALPAATVAAPPPPAKIVSAIPVPPPPPAAQPPRPPTPTPAVVATPSLPPLAVAPPAAVPPPAVTTMACPFAAPGSARIDCGTLTVPERRDHPTGKTVSIFYAITHADGRDALPDPVVMLNGGPGQPGSDLIESGWDHLAELRQRRDIIYVDQRGTGHSRPGLYCRSLSPVAFWHGGLTRADAEDCLKPIQAAGYDIAAFNTEESAADLIALRAALGVTQWNLFGTSYGTALAMEVVRRDGAAVRSVVLNSPTTPSASWLDRGRMSGIRDVYRRLFADCAADADCAAAYPDLERVFLDLAKRLTEYPLPVTYQDPSAGAPVTTHMSFATLLDTLTIVVGGGTGAERVPAVIWHLSRVARGLEPARPELLAWLYMPYWKTMDMIAYGLNAAIGCREIRPWIDATKARAEAAAFQPYVMPQGMERDYDTFCPAWKLPPGPQTLRQPVIAATPTLLLTGDYDTLTPTALADSIARFLSAAQVLRFHAIGHDVASASACGRAAVARFITAPGEPVALACLKTPRLPQFVARAER